MFRTLAKTLALVAALAAPTVALAGPTVDAIKQRGALRCGVNTGLLGFSAPDSAGRWNGIDADFCRAVATAILGDPTKVQYVPTNAQTRFTALQSGKSTCCRATPPGPPRATPPWARYSPARCSMMARASW